ncbi:uncharacterized protein METZ01_LOCUS337945, partial [marine metagenome]
VFEKGLRLEPLPAASMMAFIQTSSLMKLT